MLVVEDLAKTYVQDRSSGRVAAVDGVSLEVERGQLYTLLGPSGCGKTTTLRSIAGLEVPDFGRIALDGQVFFDSDKKVYVPTHRRGLGMVFQSYAIWPHLNVRENVSFPLTATRRRRGLTKAQINERVERVLSVVQLGHLSERQATDLSGGQQQRLALARAIALEPPLLLLDEPLSNLDAKLREEMRFELKRLQRDLGITSVYVTHDQVEALAMSTVIAVMADGRIEQIGSPREIYLRPESKFVAKFIGTSNFLEGRVVGVGADYCEVDAPSGRLDATSLPSTAVGQEVVVSIRPEHVGISEVGAAVSASGAPRWQGEVVARAFLGDAVEHQVRVGEITVRARGNPSRSIPPGTPVEIDLPREWCAVLTD